MTSEKDKRDSRNLNRRQLLSAGAFGTAGLAFAGLSGSAAQAQTVIPDQEKLWTNSNTGRRVAIINDADAAGYAEMTFGAGRGRAGLVLLVTLGTGIGTALFINGHLVPNTELGHLEVRGMEAEHRASAKARIDRGLGWAAWADAVNEVLAAYHALLWPDLFIVGGGVTENWSHFGPLLESRAEILPAHFGNDAGIIGAAMAAASIR